MIWNCCLVFGKCKMKDRLDIRVAMILKDISILDTLSLYSQPDPIERLQLEDESYE